MDERAKGKNALSPDLYAICKYLNSTVGPRYLEGRLSTAVEPDSFGIAAILPTLIMRYLELAVSNIFFTAIVYIILPGFAVKFGKGVFNGILLGKTWHNIPVKM